MGIDLPRHKSQEIIRTTATTEGKFDSTELQVKMTAGDTQLKRKTRSEARGGGECFVMLTEQETEEMIEEAEARSTSREEEGRGNAAAIIVVCNAKEVKDKKQTKRKKENGEPGR